MGDLDATVSLKGKSGNWSTTATVTAHNAEHAPASGVTVSGEWKDANGNVIKTSSGTTNGNGQVSFGSGGLNSLTSVTFCVANP